MSADIPAPVPTVGVSTQPAPSTASFAVQGLGLLMTDAWVRQSHIPLVHSDAATTARTPQGVFRPPHGNTPGFPPDRRRLSALGHIYAYKAAAVSCTATN